MAGSQTHTRSVGPESELVALLSELRDDLGYRRIEKGMRLLERMRPIIESLQPEMEASGALVGLVAQWVDAGFDHPELLRRVLARFPRCARTALPLHDYLHLRMAEGVAALAEEDLEGAGGHFRFVQALEKEVVDDELFAIANFWIGRELRRTGQYDDALTYIVRGEELALGCGYTQMAAIMQGTRSWLAFQKGRYHDALGLLGRAEEALSRTDEYLSRGNIQSAYGRILRRQGRYEQALEYCERAIAEYRAGGGGQTQLARTLRNLAFVKRLLALQAQKQLDQASASRRSSPEDAERTQRLAGRRSHIEEMRAGACAHLEEALQIYARHRNHAGMAGVHLTRAFLHLDAGDLERAAEESAQAFEYGDEKRESIVMARALTLQCTIENAAIEEQLGDPARHKEAAASFARDAVQFAGRTQKRRLLARAYVWQGITHLAEPGSDIDAARQCYEKAAALLEPEALERQHAWEDLEKLKAAVLRAEPVEPLLRAWSAGLIGDKSFQEITDDFARLIIPKIWEREGRKVSRVAERLSISPKKVRRILYSAGLLDRAIPGHS